MCLAIFFQSCKLLRVSSNYGIKPDCDNKVISFFQKSFASVSGTTINTKCKGNPAVTMSWEVVNILNLNKCLRPLGFASLESITNSAGTDTSKWQKEVHFEQMITRK